MAFSRKSGRAAKYGAEHQQLRKTLLAQHHPGDACRQVPCLRPGQPLGTDPRRIHLGHDRTGRHYIGLVHDVCNIREAAARGSRISHQRQAGRDRRHSRAWW